MTVTDPDRAQPAVGVAGGARAVSPTGAWLARVDGMPPLSGPEGTAERLLLLLHYGIDWSGGWVGRRRGTYWEALLPDRVIVATFLAPTLRGWWAAVAADLDSRPRGPAQRAELEELLRADPLPVLRVLREQTAPLLLRTRITADAVRAARAAATVEDAAAEAR